jgi:hypothetical protein
LEYIPSIMAIFGMLEMGTTSRYGMMSGLEVTIQGS